MKFCNNNVIRSFVLDTYTEGYNQNLPFEIIFPLTKIRNVNLTKRWFNNVKNEQ